MVTTGPGFDTTEQDLRWQFEVNVFGVFFGCKTFGQRFLRSGEKAWICNTGSHHSVGTPSVGLPIYVATKHAVLGFTDAFRLEMAAASASASCVRGSSIPVPGMRAGRPRRIGRTDPGQPAKPSGSQAYGLSPEFVGQLVVQGIQREEFFIWTHPFTLELIEKRYREGRDSIQRQWPDGPLPVHKRTPSRV